MGKLTAAERQLVHVFARIAYRRLRERQHALAERRAEQEAEQETAPTPIERGAKKRTRQLARKVTEPKNTPSEPRQSTKGKKRPPQA